MTALGINVSAQDPVRTWADIRRISRKKAKLEQEYLDAREEVKDLWIEYNAQVDFGEDRLQKLAETDVIKYREFEAVHLANIRDLEDKALKAEQRQHQLYVYLHCAHEFEDMLTNEPDNVIMICSKCGYKE